jgi:hypothetical protein
MLLALSIAGEREAFLDFAVSVHGPVLYLDFELDADEQHRRVEQLATGLGIEVPDDLLYVPVFGVHTPDAIQFALDKCEENGVVLAIIDSLGPAMIGDMAAAKDIIEFHNRYIAPFREVKATPVIIDHQARTQAGENYQNKGAFGSSYKEHLSRSVIQIERRDGGAGAINIHLRHKKANFGALAEAFAVRLEFSEESIEATAGHLTAGDKARETTLNAKERVLAALKELGGVGYWDDIGDITGLKDGTVKNAITALKNANPPLVVATGIKKDGGAEEVRLTDRKKSSSSSLSLYMDDDDDDADGANERPLTVNKVREIFSYPAYYGREAAEARTHYLDAPDDPQRFERLCKAVLKAARKDTRDWPAAGKVVLLAMRTPGEAADETV